MATPLTDPASPLDQETLDALREGVAAVLAEHCDSTALHAFIDGKRPLEQELWSRAAALGWFGFAIPEAYGGLGLGPQGLAILHTELGRHAVPGAYIPTLTAAQTIVERATDATQAAWLPRLAAGEVSIAIPATPNAATLTRSPSGLSGTLRCLGAPDSGFLLAPADDAWVIVALTPDDITAAPIWDRTRAVIDVTLRDAKPEAVLPDREATTQALTRAMALAVAADSSGAARSITDRTIAYMKTREQFGQPIAGFQALKHRAADLATKLAVMDETLGHAVHRTSAGAADADLWVFLAKSEVTEAAVFVTTDCVQLHGGVGFTWDFDPHIFLKRARLNEALVMANPALRDRAGACLAALTSAGQSALELGL